MASLGSSGDGHAIGLQGLPSVLARLSDHGHRCQGTELTCLLQALCKLLLSAATDTSAAIFTSADRSRAAAATTAAADVLADLSIGAPEASLPSLPPPNSAGSASSLGSAQALIDAPASTQPRPPYAASGLLSPPSTVPPHRHRLDLHPARPDDLPAPCRGAPPLPCKPKPPLAATTTTAPPPPGADAAERAAPLPAGAPATSLADMVIAGVLLLVEHLEHFHYRAKAVALEGLLALSVVGLGPDRRLDPSGLGTQPLPASGGGAASCSAAAAAAAAMAAGGGRQQLALLGQGAGAEADAGLPLGGMALGDWLALRIVDAGAVPRLLEMLTQRTGVSFVPMRQAASQVMHNLARRRSAAVRTALSRWRPLPGVISSLDVVLEDSPDIAARLLLVFSDLAPVASHQIASVMRNLVARHQQSLNPQPAAKPPQPQQPAAAAPQAGADAGNGASDGGDGGGAGAGPLPQQPAPVLAKAGSEQLAAPQQPPAGPKGSRKAKADPPAPAGVASGRAAAAPVRGRKAAAAVLDPAAAAPAAGAAAGASGPAPPPAPVPPPAPAPAASDDASTVSTTHLGLAPDVDVPLDQLLVRVTGYYMRLAYVAVLAPPPLPAAPAPLRAGHSEAERREHDKALLAARVEEHRRRRKEAAQLDCCVAALLAAAPLPTCIFEAMSYSYIRAFAILAGPPLSAGLVATTNGGLWRAQDLLPYALLLLQSLGGGSDSGDGGSAGPGAAAVGSGGGALAAAAAAVGLLPSSAGAASGSSASSGGSGGSGPQHAAPAVAASLDRLWGLEQPRDAPQGSAAAEPGCPGPSVPGAPSGDAPVARGLMQQCGVIVRAVLERAVQAADALPFTAAAVAAAAAATVAGPGAADLLAARQAFAEAPPLAVLRSVGNTLSRITRAQAAELVASCGGCAPRLAASLAQNTGSAAAGVAQARAALGLVNVWACMHAAAARAQRGAQQRRQPLALLGAGPLGGGAVVGGPSAAAPPAGGGLPAAAGAPEEPPPLAAAGPAAEPPRRSARIKRQRDGAAAPSALPAHSTSAGGASAATASAGAVAQGGIEAPGQQGQLRPASSGASAGAGEGRSGGSGGGGAGAGGGAPSTDGARGADDDPSARQRDALLASLVDLLAARFAEVRHLQDSYDAVLHQQQQQQQGPTDGANPGAAAAAATLAGPAGVQGAVGAGVGSWLAASAGTSAERGRQVLETQALLLQAVGMLLPGLEAPHARRLAEAGAASCAARLLRAATSVPPAPPPAAGTAAAFASSQQPGRHATVPASPPAGSGAAGWSDEPLYGITALQSLGVLVQLAWLSYDGDAASASYGTGIGAVQQPEVLAALGGALLLRRPQRGQGGGSAQTAGAAAVAVLLLGPSLRSLGAERLEAQEADPVGRCWELLSRMSSGQGPCPDHQAVLQLLPPLAALAHGPSARSAAVRSALLPVLLQVARWGHSRAQRRRLLAQVLALWSPATQHLLLSLPSVASPVHTAPPPLPKHLASLAPDSGAAKAAARTLSPTLPYNPNGGTNSATRTSPRGGRHGTPTAAARPLGAAGGAQRTPQWGTRLSLAAAAAAANGGGGASCAVATASISPASAGPQGGGGGVPPAEPLQTVPAPRARTRRPPVSRMAGAAASPPGYASARADGRGRRSSVVAWSAEGPGAPAGAPLVATLAGAGAAGAQREGGEVDAGSLCQLLEAVLERFADAEMVGLLHSAGWLRALCHGARCSAPHIRAPCQRALRHAARALQPAPSAAAAAVPQPPQAQRLLVELEADPELRSVLCSLDAGMAACLAHAKAWSTARERACAAPPAPPKPAGGTTAAAAAGGAAPALPAVGGAAASDDQEGPADLGSQPQAAGEQERAPQGGRRRGAKPARKATGGAGRATRSGARRAGAVRRGSAAPCEAGDEAGERTELSGGSSQGGEVAAGDAAGGAPLAEDRAHSGSEEGLSQGAGEARQPPRPLRPAAGHGAAAVASQLVSPCAKRRRLSAGGADAETTGEEGAPMWEAAPPGGLAALRDVSNRLAAAAAAVAPLAAGSFPPASAALGAAREYGSEAAAADGCNGAPGPSGGARPHDAAGQQRAAPLGAAADGAADPDAPLELQLSAQESGLAAAVLRACAALESVLAARRHDIAAASAADQAAAAAATAAADEAAAAQRASAAAAAPAAAPPQTAAGSKGTRPREGAGGKAPRGRKPSQAPPEVPPPQAAAAPAVQAPPQPQRPPAAVADEVFLSHTYRGVSKRLDFDGM